MQGSKQMLADSTIKYSFFFEKEQLVRDSFEIKGLGYIEWLEARLPAYMQGSSGGNGRLVSEWASLSQSAVRPQHVEGRLK